VNRIPHERNTKENEHNSANEMRYTTEQRSDMMMDNECSSSSITDWKMLLKKIRNMRQEMLVVSDDSENQEPPPSETFLTQFRSSRSSIREYLLVGGETMTLPESLETVLRVALCYLSIPPNVWTELRRTIQREAYDAWHVAILRLMVRNDKEHVYTKYKRTAAQVLCNSVTDCVDTATHLMNLVAPDPTPTSIVNQILATHLHDDIEKKSDMCESELSHTSLIDTSWVDLLLACASHRSTLAVVVACLHNCLCCLSKSSDVGYVEDDRIRLLASSKLLISTLLRLIVSAVAVQQVVSISPTTTSDAADDATEWIVLALSKLCRLGFLQQMYQNIQSGGIVSYVLPEHIVLLHSVRNIVEESRNDELESNLFCKSRCYMLGGEGKEHGKSVVDTHLFLTDLYGTLRENSSKQLDRDNELRISAIQLVLDVLAESLAEDSNIASTIRYTIGTETSFLQTILLDLAAVLDDWYAQNKGIYTRNQTKMNEVDQCRITASVRVLGNLCFQCRHNQDMLRQTVVPYGDEATGAKNVPYTEKISKKRDRNGLHVLLSTTSMSYACFTLREWAVVAIRAALEECPENQAVIEELEAQSSMHNSDLEDMGIRVNLDVAKGTVSVTPANDDSNLA
jgi:Spinocerebellar ataxia type 10 protein domain